MNLKICTKHQISFNSESVDSCPLCKHEKTHKDAVKLSSLYLKNYPKKYREIYESKPPDGEQNLYDFIRTMPPICFSRSKIKEIVLIKIDYIKTLRHIYKLSYSQIGRIMKLDHSTVMHHINK
jgi:transposase-like protein